ncbi:MAG: triose-phosphate isomerase [Eubacteriales bacterium]|nr:triose-phosphate isomerase [Eubacteriales bacterium]
MNKKYRKAIIAGNWKMNMLASQVKSFADALYNKVGDEKGCEALLCVPSPFIPALIAAHYRRLGIGAQDVSEYDSGAYTGEVSAQMLSDIGVRYCIVGHSERRQYHGETDSQVNRKVHQLLKEGISPIICVGESLEQRDKDLTMEYVGYQVKAALWGVTPEQLRRCVIAYEPIWAIGTGRTATAEQAQEVCGAIRERLRRQYGARFSRSVSILYGGSMSPKNASQLLAQPDVDGGLIGGASLDPESFARIIEFARLEG